MKSLFGVVLFALAALCHADNQFGGYLENRAPYPLVLVFANCTSGAWTAYPPSAIQPGYSGALGSGARGTLPIAGNVVYSVAQGGPQVYFRWFVPAFGQDNFTYVAIPPNVLTAGQPLRNGTGTWIRVAVYQQY